jgi:hypothetical protein
MTPQKTKKKKGVRYTQSASRPKSAKLGSNK